MLVRNILVNDRVEFSNGLARILGLRGISYVQVDNEFHFQDSIYRMYDKESLMECAEDISDEMAIVKVFYPFQLVSLGYKNKPSAKKLFVDFYGLDEDVKMSLMALTEDIDGPTTENVFSTISSGGEILSLEDRVNKSKKKFTKKDIKGNNYKVKQMVNPYKR